MAHLTKTRFKEGLECPDRMFYYGKKNEYADVRSGDDFLLELAKTGIQVGELAKAYYPGGIEVGTLNYEEAVAQTNKLLEQTDIIIYEAALSTGNLLVRVDILVKRGDVVELIEAKSKSFFKESELFTKNGIDSKWKEYVYDIAFQVYVAKGVFQKVKIQGSLLLIDKTKQCTVDGLYQKFPMSKVDGRYKVSFNPSIEIGQPILSKVDLTEKIDQILNGEEKLDEQMMPFSEYVEKLSVAVQDDRKFNVATGRHCKSCPYKIAEPSDGKKLKSGFKECWANKSGFEETDFIKPSVFDIWNLNYLKLEGMLASKQFFAENIKKEELLPKTKSKDTKRLLSTADRQWLQIERCVKPDVGPYVNKNELKTAISQLTFPLHFIDFEVAMNGIPYRKGLRPYHQFAFQFSHHVLADTGKLTHAGQWIETRIGENPNIEFVRNLKEELTKDEGSILIYSSYENSILLHLHDEVNESAENDKISLIEFIRSITWNEEKEVGWRGKRAMVDMLEWIMDSYLSRQMGKSNSIKVVLPALINDSTHLQKKYGSKIYGTNGMPSLNFNGKQWIEVDKLGQFVNPYNLLPPVFDGLNRQSIELLFDDEELANGGAAMCAYNLMQFAEMSNDERSAIISALYKYCELDTLAMVMVYEGLKDLSN